MHEETLPPGSRQTLDWLARQSASVLTGWTLAGGTGLALQLGHRISEDFDFFRTDAVDLRALHGVFQAGGAYETLQETRQTMTVRLAQTKLSFFCVRDPFLFTGEACRFFTIAAVTDIALMKIAAIAGRGSRKDFVDLFFILSGSLTLRQSLELVAQKYGANRVNRYHLLKSLVYFDDAEREPMPRMLAPVDWEACKRFFVQAVRDVTL